MVSANAGSSPFQRRLPGTYVFLRKHGKAGFDGNLSDQASRFLLPTGSQRTVTPAAIAMFMKITAEGDLSWVAFPPEVMGL